MTIYGDTTAWILILGGVETIIGDTNTSTTITDLNTTEVDLCVEGMLITGSGIPVGTYITAVGVDNITISQAATATENDVTLTIQDALYLKTDKQPILDDVDEGVVNIKYPNRGHFGFTTVIEDVKVKIAGVYAKDKTEWDELKAGIRAIQDSTTIPRLRIQVHSTPLYEAFDGTTGIWMPIRLLNVRGKKKTYGGNSTVYEISMITLVQTGALATL